MSEECIHLIDPATCTICNGHDRRLKQQQALRGHRFLAKYASRCCVCHDEIAVGDLIYWIEGEPAIHDECTGER